VRAAAAALGLLSAALLGATLLGLGPLLIPWLGVLVVTGALAGLQRTRVRRALRECEAPARDLALLARLLAVLEDAELRAARLVSLQRAVATRGVPASRRIRRLGRLVELADARRNQLFAPLAALLLWTTQLAFAIESWRAACGSALGRWIEVLGELEALVALAGYAYEEAEQPFPELLGEGARFEAEALAHPLLPRDRCVANDVALGDAPRVWVVSGSNMSGKSTLLRSVGANAVLAFAGAPVRARRLRISPLAIGASIRVGDSLLGGTSRFYAEIQRLRRIVELAEGPGPALFLLDEILAGTNSHDRGIGAEAVVRGLLERGAIGLVTTHDLALARIADGLAPRGANVHFEDHIQDGVIAFDYRLRPGVVQRSNALALMRAVGLEV
jgi:DNA mismatch repair ATPase MutS